MRAWLVVVFAVWAALAGLSCNRAAPQLVTVTDAEPREVYLGDEMRFAGRDFPVSRTASVTLEGVLFTAGAPARTLHLTLPARPTDSGGLAIRFDAVHEAALWGAGQVPRHASFRGAAALEFDGRPGQTLAVGGRLEALGFELYPSATSQNAAQRDLSRVQGTLSYLGLDSLSPLGRSQGGLTVDRLDPRGPAAQAGLRAGDTISEIGRVAAVSARDFLLQNDQQSLTLLVERPGYPTPFSLTLDVQRLSPSAPLPLRLAVVAVLGACLGLVVFLGPWATLYAWLAQRTRQRLLPRPPRAQAVTREVFRLRLWDVACLVALGVGAVPLASSAMPAPATCLLTVLGAAWGCALLAACWDGGKTVLQRPGPANASTFGKLCTVWSLRGGLAAGFAQLQLTLPGGALLLVVAASRQGPAMIGAQASAFEIGSWAVWEGAVEIGAALGLGLWTIPTSVGRPWEVLRNPAARDLPTRGAYAYCQALTQASVLLLVVAMFFGGWQMPGSQGAWAPRTLLGALGFELKWLALVWAVTRIRRWFVTSPSSALAGPTLVELTGCANRCLGAWLLVLALGVGAFGLGHALLLHWLLAEPFWLVLAAGLGVLVTALTLRFTRTERRRSGTCVLELNPWL